MSREAEFIGKLLGAQSKGWIDRCCAKRGIGGREQGNRNQHERRRSEGNSVQRRNAEESRAHELRQPTGEEETDSNTRNGEA